MGREEEYTSDRVSTHESQVDNFDVDFMHEVMQAWKSIPQDIKYNLVGYARMIWPVQGTLLARLVIIAFGEMRRGVPKQVALYRAAHQLGFEANDRGNPRGLSRTQVEQYQRPHMQRLPSHRRKPRYRF